MGINIGNDDITGATIDGQDVSEITVDGETVFTAIPDSVVDTFDYLSSGEALDGENGWTDNSGHMRGITSFSQTFTFNAVGRAVSSVDSPNIVNKGECFRSLPDAPYGRLRWIQSNDGGAPSGASFISFRQNNSDVVKIEMNDTGDGAAGDLFVNDSFIADNNDGGFASDGATHEFDLTIDYDNNSISGSVIQTNTNTTKNITENFVNSASGLDEIYLWNNEECAIIVDEIEVLGE